MRTRNRFPILSRPRRGAALAAILWTALLAPCAWGQAWWNSSWTQRQQLVFNNRDYATPLVNFPVLVILDAGRIDFSQTRDAGEDVRFIDADGTTVLSHEIERWDEGGACYVWVKIPQIDAYSDTDCIWLYYGNPTAADGQNRAAVWDANFAMVQHLEETAGALTDSTAYACDGTNNGAAPAAGVVGGGYSFNGTSSYLNVPHKAALSTTAAVTLSAWVNAAAGGLSDWRVALNKGTSANRLNYWLGVNATNPAFSFNGGAVQDFFPAGTNLQTATWYHLAATFDDAANAVRIYVDGRLVHTVSTTAAPAANAEALWIGKSQWGEFWKGSLDELRVSRTVRSADWINAEYRTATDSLLLWPTPGKTPPTLWGVDQLSGQLFSSTNYLRLTASATVYGSLMYHYSGADYAVGGGVTAMAIDDSRTAYFAIDKSLGGFARPVLASFSLASATTTGTNRVTLLGSIGVGATAVQGLAIDRTTDTMYALTATTLYRIDRTNGQTLATVGSVSGAGYSCTAGRDLAFDRDGNLYVIDAADDHLYQVNKTTGTIAALLDADTCVATGGDRALAYDHILRQLIAANTNERALKRLTVGNGLNPALASWAAFGSPDLQAIAFDPKSGNGGPRGVRILSCVEIP